MRKVGRIALHLGEGWEEVMRLCLLAMGDAAGTHPLAPRRSGATPRPRTRPCAPTPSSSSSRPGVIDLETAQEQLGYSPEQVRQMRERRQASQPDPTAPAACHDRRYHPHRRRLHGRRHQHRSLTMPETTSATEAQAAEGAQPQEGTTPAQVAEPTLDPAAPPARAGRGPPRGGQVPHRPAQGHRRPALGVRAAPAPGDRAGAGTGRVGGP